MEYTILIAGDASALTSRVTRLIAEGWQPQGGVVLSETRSPDEDEAQETWAQAMVRHEPVQ